jgi:uncharacterized Zn-finger protein
MKVAKNVNECAICCKVFPKTNALPMHMEKHLTDYLQVSQDKTSLKEPNEEMKTKKDIKTTFSCQTCGKTIKSKDSLKIHERIHSGEKPYSCKFCIKKFRLQNGLKDHERIHTGEKPFPCTFCDKKFRARSNRSEHEKLIHKRNNKENK